MQILSRPRFASTSYEKPQEKTFYQKVKTTGKWAAVTAALGAVGYTAATGVAAMGEHYHLWHANDQLFPWLDNKQTAAKSKIIAEKDHLIYDLQGTIARQNHELADQIDDNKALEKELARLERRDEESSDLLLKSWKETESERKLTQHFADRNKALLKTIKALEQKLNMKP